MSDKTLDIRSRPAFLHDYYGARRDTPEFEVARRLNGRTGSRDPEQFARSRSTRGSACSTRSFGSFSGATPRGS